VAESKEQLENCRTYINMLNVKSLNASELFQLASILFNCKGKAQEAEKSLGSVVTNIKGMSEDSYAFVWDKIPAEHHSTGAIKLPHITYDQDKASIEKEFSSRKVRQVHYRK